MQSILQSSQRSTADQFLGDLVVPPSADDRSVLVLDDDAESAEELTEILSDGGFWCRTMTDPKLALETVMRDPSIAVVVTDLRMPGLDGIELAKAIERARPRDRHIAVILVSGHGDTQAAVAALRVGAHDFLAKPISPPALLLAAADAMELMCLRTLQERYHSELRSCLDRQEESLALLAGKLKGGDETGGTNERLTHGLLTMIGRELRTGLTDITGLAEKLVDPTKSTDDPIAQVYSAQIDRSAHGLLRVIDVIVEYVELQGGTLLLDRIDVRIGNLLTSVLDAMRPRIKIAQQKLETRIDKSLPVISGDPVRLTRAISNVVDNAIRFSPPGSRLTVSASRHGDKVGIVIRDEGRGMSEGRIREALEPFWQIDASRPKSLQGIGLGLAIARLLIELHGGSIDIDSAPGEGTEVTIWLPVPPGEG